MVTLYGLLVIGALTTLLPFVMMLSTGFKGPTDQNDNRIIPGFWRDHEELFEKYVVDKYSGDLSRINSTRIGEEASPELIAKYEEFLMGLEPDFFDAGFRAGPNQLAARLTKQWQSWVKQKYGQIEAVNRAYLTMHIAFQSVAPQNEALDRKGWSHAPGQKNEDWREFKRTLPVEFRLPIRAERMFQEFLRSEFENQFSRVPADLALGARSFEEVRKNTAHPLYQQFEQEQLPERFQEATVEELWARISSEPMPIVAQERAWVQQHHSEIRSEFTWRNYLFVLDYFLLNGRALVNTLIFCGLAIITQLTVNPLAAYALSRYPMRATAKILLFLLATMAFPAEVAMIPSFLLLKELDLLNTFAALVLPAAASGFSIFLLKGFFDSLPQEYFESGQIDGAKEHTLMWKIAFPLSKPVFGYMALLAFMGAYGAFMFAFLVVQDQRMWTLMVSIYQLQAVAPKATMMAAITLAAIPTLVVFLFAQRVIMRGIILPSER